MDSQSMYEDLHRELQEKRQQRKLAEREERMLEERLKTAKLQRSLSTQGSSLPQSRCTKLPGVRRQSAAASMMRGAQRSPANTTMTRSFTVSSEHSMPLLPEFSSMTSGIFDRLGQDEPINVALQRPGRTSAGEYPTPDCGANPSDYLEGLAPEDDFVPDDFFPFVAPPSSAPPSLVSGGDSIATPMSRESSSGGGSYLQPQELSRSDSTLSPSLERYPSYETYGITNAQQSQTAGKAMYGGHDMLVGMGSSFSPSSEAVTMSRSISNISTSSARSTNSKQGERAKEAHERHIYNSLRTPIAAKPTGESEKSDSSSASSKKDGKIALAKKEYQRPKHPRVMCKKCNDHVEGFRGQHELMRHMASKHAVIVTKWQVRDPRKVNITTGLEPITPLDKCKACQGSKLYGAYYNVAAHLRRSHFRVKRRGKHGKNKLHENNEKLGRDDPPMHELKKWMVQVQVRPGDVRMDDTETVEDKVDFDYGHQMSPTYSTMPDLAVSPDTGTSMSSASPYEMPMAQIPSDLAYDMFDAATYATSMELSRSFDNPEYTRLADALSMGIAI